MSNFVMRVWEDPAIVGQGSLKKVTQWDNGISGMSPISEVTDDN